MKRNLSLLAVLALLSLGSNAQTYWKAGSGKSDIVWDYNLSGNAGTTSAYGLSQVSASSSAAFLPGPLAGNVAITTYPRSTNATLNSPATFYLSGNCMTANLTMTSTGGNGVENGGGISSFVVNQIPEATEIMSAHFNLALGANHDNTNANWYIAIGRSSHSILSAANNKSLEHTNRHDHDDRLFAVWRYIKSPTYPTRFAFSKMEQTTSDFNNGNGKTWSSTAAANLESNTSYAIDIYCNNSTTTQQYIRDGNLVNLASGKYAIYVDGSLKGEFDKNAISTSATGSRPLNGFAVFSRDPAKSGSVQDNSSSLTISNLKIVYLGTAVSTAPVTLTSFEGEKTTDGIVLNWKTAGEIRNSHFILNRSANGSDFSYAARIEGNGTSSNAFNYSYLDKAPFAGNNYYRLEQVDTDGSKTLIDRVVIVKYTVSDEIFSVAALSVNQLKVNVSSNKNQKAELFITDISGKRIYKSNEFLKQGINQIDVFMPYVKPGVYVATVKNSGETRSIKFIL